MTDGQDPLLTALKQALESDPTNLGTKKLLGLELFKKGHLREAYPLLLDVFDQDQDIAVERAIHDIEREIEKEGPAIGFGNTRTQAERALEELTEKRGERITFADVAGMDAVKEAIRMDILYPLQHPEMAKIYKLKSGGGILMYGPPGCGKTFIAKATAGELNATFIPVSIHEIISGFTGEGERALHGFFEAARRQAPAVLFFDELDAIGGNRSRLGGPMRTLVNQFLTELDGVGTNNEKVLIIGATNLPWEVDDALRRPGRFDKVLFITPPDQVARKRMFELQFKDKPSEALDCAALAAAAEGFSAADIRKVSEESSDKAFRQALRTGEVVKITSAEVLAAIGQSKPTIREWFQTVKSYIAYANQTGLYDEVKKYIDTHKL
jgi:transitional endoplasmic reticulum ATPase